jgi:hypothetical protein
MPAENGQNPRPQGPRDPLDGATSISAASAVNLLRADLEHAAGSGAGRVTSRARSAPLAAQGRSARITFEMLAARSEQDSRPIRSGFKEQPCVLPDYAFSSLSASWPLRR